MARYRSTRRRTPRRRSAPRRNGGIRRSGALIVNGRRRRKTTRRKTTRRKTARRKSTARRNGRRRAVARRRSPRRRTARRRSTRRNGRKRRAAPRTMYRRYRTNGRRRPARRRKRRTRRNPLVIRRNGRRRTARRRSTRRRTRRNGSVSFGFKLPFLAGISKMVSKLPVVGKPLAAGVGFLAPAALGAASVLPTTFVAQFAGQYVPRLNSSIFYALVGAGLAGVVASFKLGGASFSKALAIAMAAGGGAVALYKWQTGDDAPMAVETGRLMVRGPMAGIGSLFVGRRQIGSVGGYGPEAVRPMAQPYGHLGHPW